MIYQEHKVVRKKIHKTYNLVHHAPIVEGYNLKMDSNVNKAEIPYYHF
jgi:hypothetical protein